MKYLFIVLSLGLVLSGCVNSKERYKYDFNSKVCVKQSLETSNDEIKNFYNKNTDCKVTKAFGTAVVIQCNNGNYVKNYQSYAYTESRTDCQEFEIAAAALKSEGL